MQWRPVYRTWPNSGKKEAVVERQKIPNEEVAIHSLRVYRSETGASQEATETELHPGTMQSVEEHQEIPKEEAAGRRTEEAA
jgi:hypothetical protein